MLHNSEAVHITVTSMIQQQLTISNPVHLIHTVTQLTISNPVHLIHTVTQLNMSQDTTYNLQFGK